MTLSMKSNSSFVWKILQSTTPPVKSTIVYNLEHNYLLSFYKCKKSNKGKNFQILTNFYKPISFSIQNKNPWNEDTINTLSSLPFVKNKQILVNKNGLLSKISTVFVVTYTTFVYGFLFST